MKLAFSADTSKIGVALEKVIANKSKVLDSFGKATIKRTQQDIINEQSPDGKKFAPLTKYTLAQKRKLGYILAILRATDEMLNAFTSEVDGDRVSIIQPKSYGRELQEGRSDMPSRPFLGFTDNDAKVLIQLFLQEIRR
jgi:phage gpG-like protein